MNGVKEANTKASEITAAVGAVGCGTTGKSIAAKGIVIGATAKGTKDSPAAGAAKVCADGGVEAVARQHDRVVGEREEL